MYLIKNVQRAKTLKIVIFFHFLFLLIASPFTCANEISNFNKIKQSREDYRAELDRFRRAFGGSYALPKVKFYLFDMANREKLIYKNGVLYNAFNNKLVYKWDVEEEVIAPHIYTVKIKTKD